MTHLLDTNICIHFMRGAFNLDKRFEQVGLKNCAISEITLAELAFGAQKSKYIRKNQDLIESFVCNLTVLPILEGIPIYASEKVRLQNAGKMISDFDLLIGATCLAHDLTMVTENIKEFNRISGIKIES